MSNDQQTNEVEGQTAAAQPETPENKGTSREAKYRNRAKDAEQQVERLNGLLTGARKSILRDSLRGLNPQAARDLLRDMPGEQVASFFDDDGTLSADRIDEYTDGVLKEKPYMRAETAEAKLKALETAKQLAQWQQQVSDDTGVPAEVLRGSTLEEIKAHASLLRDNADKIHPKGLKIPGIGDQPEYRARTDRWSNTFQ